jgi:hypothetical protein
MAKKNVSVLVAKDSCRIVTQKEEIVKFPTLESIWIMLDDHGNELVDYFISADHFISYLKDLIENKNYLPTAVERVFEHIFDYICDYSWEENGEALSDDFDYVAFMDVIKTNFKTMYELYKSKK